MRPILRQFTRRWRSAALGMYLSAASAGAGAAVACAYQQVPINAHAPPSLAIYSGHGKDVELQFSNEREQEPVEVFPEPPLRVLDRRVNSACDIDGGIWVRKDVYLSADELTLLTREYSGNNEQLIFYATRTCRKLAEIDLTNARFSLERDRLVIRRAKAAGNQGTETAYRFTGQCIPIKASLKGKR